MTTNVASISTPSSNAKSYSFDGYKLVEDYSYDENGNISQKSIFKYDENGTLLAKLIDENLDDKFDSCLRFDESGNINEILYYQYANNMEITYSDLGADGTIDSSSAAIYDENDNVIQSGFDDNNDGIIDETLYFEYDDKGQMTKRYSDNNNDGIMDEETLFTYNENGEKGLQLTRKIEQPPQVEVYKDIQPQQEVEVTKDEPEKKGFFAKVGDFFKGLFS